MRKFLPLVSLLEVFKQHKEPPVQYEVFHLTINPFWYYVWWVLCMKVYLSANFPNAFLYCHILSKVEMHLKLVWLLCFAGSIFSKLANSFCKCNANHYTATFYQRQHDPGNLKIAMFDVVANHSIVISWDLLRGKAPKSDHNTLYVFMNFDALVYIMVCPVLQAPVDAALHLVTHFDLGIKKFKYIWSTSRFSLCQMKTVLEGESGSIGSSESLQFRLWWH